MSRLLIVSINKRIPVSLSLYAAKRRLDTKVEYKPHKCSFLEFAGHRPCRPAVSKRRLSLTSSGKVRYQLKTPYRNGTTHVTFEPVEFITKLAALIRKPRVNLTRYHGIFVANSRHRAQVTPGFCQLNPAETNPIADDIILRFHWKQVTFCHAAKARPRRTR